RLILVAGRSHAENSATVAVALLMAADAGVIPVAHEQRAVRGHARIHGTEPVVLLLAVQDVDDVGLVAGTIGRYGISADDARTGVTVNDLVTEDGGQQVG